MTFGPRFHQESPVPQEEEHGCRFVSSVLPPHRLLSPSLLFFPILFETRTGTSPRVDTFVVGSYAVAGGGNWDGSRTPFFGRLGKRGLLSGLCLSREG